MLLNYLKQAVAINLFAGHRCGGKKHDVCLPYKKSNRDSLSPFHILRVHAMQCSSRGSRVADTVARQYDTQS